MAVHKGKTKRVRFSYRAKSRSIFEGTLISLLATVGFFDTDFSYAFNALELRGATSKTYTCGKLELLIRNSRDCCFLTGIPRLSRRPVHCGYYKKGSDWSIVDYDGFYKSSSLVVFFDVDCIVQFFEVILFPPILSGFELRKGFLGDELSSSQIAPEQMLAMRSEIRTRRL